MRKILAAIVAAIFLAAPALGLAASSVTLEWDANTETDLAGYKIYWGSSSRTYTQNVDVKNVTSYTVEDLADGTWYFAATAYNTSGAESDYSNEVFTTINSIPPGIPKALKMLKISVTNTVQVPALQTQ